MVTDDVKPDDLQVTIKAVARTAERAELVVRLSNRATRALHYISDVRATRYDPATKTLTLALSDEGRQLIPGVIEKVPVFRHIDPGNDAEIVVKIPERIVKLSRTAPPGELAFETHNMEEIEEVVVDVAWADVPFYKDTRPEAKNDPRMPAARSEQHKAHAVQNLREKNTKR